MNLIILLRLLFAHFVGDFLCQPDRLNKGKRKELKGQKYHPLIYQAVHSLILAALSYLFVAEWNNWIIPSVIFVAHFVIDFIKSSWLKNNIYTFILDQFLHVAVIIILWAMLYCKLDHIAPIAYSALSNKYLLFILISYLLILKPTSILLKLFIERWTPTEHKFESLPNAGKWIGYLERVLILTFIISSNLTAVGFLLAAKSIFRFGELNKEKDIKLTEYVLIGTFASFTIAILIGLILRALLIRC